MTTHSTTRPALRAPFRLRTSFVAGGIALVVFAGLFFWHSLRTAPAHKWTSAPIQVTTSIVRPAAVADSLKAIGSLKAVQQVLLTPEVEGRVVAIQFDAGSSVKAGDLLVELNDAPERASLKAAQAKAALAQIELERAQRLSKAGAQSLEILQQSQSERDQDAAAVEQLNAQIAQKEIRAPFAGEVGIRQIDLGQHLNPGDPIATLTNLDALYVNFSLPQQDLVHIKPGATVSITTDARPGQTFTGQVNAVEPQIDENTRNVSIQAIVPNLDHALRPGMYVNATLDLPAEPDTITVPATAIQTSASGESVIVVRSLSKDGQGKAASVPVTTGRHIDNDVVILSGLRAGDVVVTEGQLRVRPGDTVATIPAAGAQGR